jgi:hypothetical protein
MISKIDQLFSQVSSLQVDDCSLCHELFSQQQAALAASSISENNHQQQQQQQQNQKNQRRRRQINLHRLRHQQQNNSSTPLQSHTNNTKTSSARVAVVVCAHDDTGDAEATMEDGPCYSATAAEVFVSPSSLAPSSLSGDNNNHGGDPFPAVTTDFSTAALLFDIDTTLAPQPPEADPDDIFFGISELEL